MAGNSKPFTFNDNQYGTATVDPKQEKKKHSITVENPNKQGCPAEVTSDGASNDENFIANR